MQLNPAGPIRNSRTSSKGGGGALALAILGVVLLANSSSARSGTIVYASDLSGIFQLYLMDAGDTEPLGPVTDGSFETGEPEWSPDGTRIVFTGGEYGSYDVYLANADGSDLINLTDGAYGNDGGAVFSSPCPTTAANCLERIAFHSQRDGDYNIYAMTESGGALTQITSNPGDDLYPTWSPDGTKIAFMGERGTGYFDIYVLDLETGKESRYTTSDYKDEAWPAWSPDGRTILYVSNETGSFRIWVMEIGCTPECGAHKRLLIPDKDANGDPVIVTEYDPAWSPDSQWIAFSSNRDPSSPEPNVIQSDYDLFVVRADGTGLTQLTFDDSGNDFTPAWAAKEHAAGQVAP